MNTIRYYYKRKQCAFLCCQANSSNRDIILEAIEKSRLTYIIYVMEDSYCYCVFNNAFAPDDFRKLIVDWCGRFNMENIFVTRPQRNRNGSDKPVTVGGFYYNRYGVGQLKCGTKQVEEKINQLEASSLRTELHKSSYPVNYNRSANGYVLGKRAFKQLYPHLVYDSKSFIKSGIGRLDGIYGTFRKGSLYSVGGSNKALNKALFLDLVLRTAKYSISHGTGVKVYYYCLKARGKSIREKLVKMSGLSSEEFADFPIEIIEKPNCTIDEIAMSILEKWEGKEFKLITIDNLELIQGNKQEFAHKLSELANLCNFPIVLMVRFPDYVNDRYLEQFPRLDVDIDDFDGVIVADGKELKVAKNRWW